MLIKQTKISKFIYLLLIFIILSTVISFFVMPNKSFAYTQFSKDGIENFPESYRAYLTELKEEHPNWNFEAYYTGISWDELVSSETDCGHNRIIATADSLWKCSCGNVAAGYACASDDIIKYYMDPRNFLKNDVLVFQFLEMTYNSSVQNKEGVESIIKNTFMNSSVYIEGHGTMTYAEIIMEAAKESNMSPYSIATKIIQEVGSKGSASVTGTYAGYENNYNFYNYGAYDGGEAISNGLQYAKEHGWNNQYTAIVEGAKLLANSYTNQGQNTAYFYKWDVIGTTSSELYRHQYMTNIQDPKNQSQILYNTYLNNSILDASLNFIIPIYDNMPNLQKLPTTLTSADGELYYSVGTDINVRSSPGTSTQTIGKISELDEVVAMIDRKVATADGLEWDKVKLSNGVIGYVASKYLATCSTSDSNNNNDKTIPAIGTATVSITSGYLQMRYNDNTSSTLVYKLINGTEIEILQKDVSNNNDYTWYKVRYNGLVGYVASEFLTNIRDISDEKVKIENNTAITIPNMTVSSLAENMNIANYVVTKDNKEISKDDKVGTGYIITNKDTNETNTIIVKGDVNGDGEIKATDYMRIKNHIMGTSTLTNEELSAADVNNDDTIKATDYMKIKNYIMNASSITI